MPRGPHIRNSMPRPTHGKGLIGELMRSIGEKRIVHQMEHWYWGLTRVAMYDSVQPCRRPGPDPARPRSASLVAQLLASLNFKGLPTIDRKRVPTPSKYYRSPRNYRLVTQATNFPITRLSSYRNAHRARPAPHPPFNNFSRIGLRMNHSQWWLLLSH